MKTRNIIMIDAAVLIFGSIAGTIVIFLHASMPFVPWEFAKRSVLTLIAPIVGLMYPAPASDWFLSRPFCAAWVLIVLGFIALQVWKKKRWALALGVMAALAWCSWAALYHLAAIYASC